MEGSMRFCPTCGKSFIWRGGRQSYCSSECREFHKNEMKRLKRAFESQSRIGKFFSSSTLSCNYGTIPVPSGGGSYDKGSTVRIEAIESVDVTDVSNNRPEYEFMRWSDGSTQRVRDIVLENDLTLTAEYNSVGLY